ncbi:MAG: hypothetical protein DRJ42_01565 [Deltaproteobacteria bacterium]|nr:MAG: hypothetical protein DRJ42_01565 [Deltaproteobacteria bacterium]
MPTSGLSQLDRAYAHRYAGEGEDALRLALAIFEASNDELQAAALISEVLTEEGRPEIAKEALTRLVDASVRRGDMGGATVAICLAVDAGAEGNALRTSVAEVFARDSKRARPDAHPTPPPLPTQVELSAEMKSLSGPGLLDRAEEGLRAWLATADPADADAPVPQLPLSSALASATLGRLLEAATISDAAAGATIIDQGAEGKAAFLVVRGMAEAVRTAGESEVRLAALGPGALFGEMALVSDAPRAASVRALEPTRMLCFPRDTLEKLAKRDPSLGRELGSFCQARMVANLMRHSGILAAVEVGEREELMARFETRTFEAGERLVTHDEEAGGLFLLASGTVAVSRVDEDGDHIHITDLGPGDVVGEISLVLRRPATADVTARHHTVALELSRDQFQQAIKKYPTLLGELYELATTRDEETRSVVAQEALDVEDVVLL